MFEENKPAHNTPSGGVMKVTDRKNIPKDGIYLTEAEAKRMQWELIATWKPKTDVWPFRYGSGTLGAVAGFSGFVVNTHYRKMLNLGKSGRLSSYLPLVVLPTVISAVCHHNFVSSDILINKNMCPLCVELHSMIMQLQCGVVYPMIIGPLSTFYLAKTWYTCAIPEISKFKDLFKFYAKITRPLLGRLTVLAALNCAAATVLTYYEAKSISKVQTKLMDKFLDPH